eukprot:5732218-Prymnesium_polylepis.1
MVRWIYLVLLAPGIVRARDGEEVGGSAVGRGSRDAAVRLQCRTSLRTSSPMRCSTSWVYTSTASRRTGCVKRRSARERTTRVATPLSVAGCLAHGATSALAAEARRLLRRDPYEARAGQNRRACGQHAASALEFSPPAPCVTHACQQGNSQLLRSCDGHVCAPARPAPRHFNFRTRCDGDRSARSGSKCRGIRSARCRSRCRSTR